ncbi:respiratory nitrate reductase subunit gamma, partial [Mycobacterium sp. ITM-2017-0098]
VLGAIAGVTTLTGIALLVYRRRTTGPVFSATTVNDKVMYAVLVMAIVAGLACTLIGATPVGAEHDYRQTVSPWFRSIWILQPRGDLMVLAPAWFQIHVMIALTLFCLWPFTRLVHVFSAPIGYLFRPYIVYRSRDLSDSGDLVGSRPHRRGW